MDQRLAGAASAGSQQRRIEFVKAGGAAKPRAASPPPAAAPAAAAALAVAPPMDAATRALVRWQRAKGPARGLRNLGNTCFMNATLQCLASTPTAVQALQAMPMAPPPPPQAQAQQRKGKRRPPPLPPFDAFSSMQSIFQRLHDGASHKAVVPNDLALSLHRISPELHHGSQEDAHEFLISLLHCMEGSRGDSPERRRDKTAALARCFGGSFRSVLTCPACRHSSTADEAWSPLDLQLNVGASITSLEAALRVWGEQVTLGADNMWRCGGCRAEVRAHKRMTIVAPPASLIITLKRWGTRSGGRAAGMLARWKGQPHFQAAKITMHIAFPLVLDLAPVVYAAAPGGSGACPYDLTGVLVHRGSSPHDGHYIAFCKSPAGQWARHDDELVAPAKAEDVLAAGAYLLFYTRRVVPASAPASAPASVPASEAAGSASCAASEAAGSASSAAPAQRQPVSVEDLEELVWEGGGKAPAVLSASALVFASSIPASGSSSSSSSSSSSGSGAVANASAASLSASASAPVPAPTPAAQAPSALFKAGQKRRRFVLPGYLVADVNGIFAVEGLAGVPKRFSTFYNVPRAMDRVRILQPQAGVQGGSEEGEEAEAEAPAGGDRRVSKRARRRAAEAGAGVRPGLSDGAGVGAGVQVGAGAGAAPAAAAAAAPPPPPRASAYTMSSTAPPARQAGSGGLEVVQVTGKRRSVSFNPEALQKQLPGLKASPARPFGASAFGSSSSSSSSGISGSFGQPSWDDEDQDMGLASVALPSSSGSGSGSGSGFSPWGPAPQLQTHGGGLPPAPFVPHASAGSSGSGSGSGHWSGSGAAGAVSWDEALDLGRKKKVKVKGGALPTEAFSGASNSFAQKSLAKQEARKGGHF